MMRRGLLQLYLCDKSPEKHSVVGIWLQWLVIIGNLGITASLTPCFIV